MQCAIPVFDGLLPEPHNQAILSLLFTCAHWHGLAKLSMHTDPTLDILDNVTVQLRTEFRAFTNKTCPAFNTRELRHETESRNRCKQKKGNGGQTKLLSPQHLKMNPRVKHLTWSNTNTMCSVIMQPPYVSIGLQIHIPLNWLVPM